ncbi:MAG: ribonuclease M5 [bacterium]
MKYNEVIVVEGKNDQERIARLFKDVLIITTNGSEINKDTINTLVTLSKTNDIILFLDPDFPGERIRKTIENYIPNCKHAFIKKHEAISNNKKKVGIEHATDEVLKDALNNLLTKSNQSNNITISNLITLGLAGDKESTILRNKISNHLNIGCPNAKSFLKRINFLGLTIEDLKQLISK